MIQGIKFSISYVRLMQFWGPEDIVLTNMVRDKILGGDFEGLKWDKMFCITMKKTARKIRNKFSTFLRTTLDTQHGELSHLNKC